MDIVEKIIDFIKQQKGRRLKILTPKWILQISSCTSKSR